MVELPSFNKKRQDGQALLLILLMMSLVLTLVLSSVSRSVTDVEISKNEDNSIRAFDAAQAGIEKAVRVGEITSGTTYNLPNNATYTPIIGLDTTTANFFRYPLELMSGESAIISFVDHKVTTDGDYTITCEVPGSCGIPTQMRICWGLSGTPSGAVTTPALYMEYYYNSDTLNPRKWENLSDLSSIRIATASADPNTGRGNHFSAPETGGGIPCPAGEGWQFSTRYDVGTGSSPILPSGLSSGSLLFLKITMLYNTNPQPLGLRSAQPLPSQGTVISSTGQSGDVYRKLVLFQGYPEIPFEIGNVVYSKQNLTK